MKMKLITFLTVAVLCAGVNTTANGYNDVMKVQLDMISKCMDKLENRGCCGKYNQRSNIAFSATLTKNRKNLGNNGIIIFDAANLNWGKGYNPISGKFTAPMSGLYKFDWTALTKPESHCISCLVQDGASKACNHPGDKDNWDAATQTLILELKAKETVWLQARGKACDYIVQTPYSIFNGFLL